MVVFTLVFGKFANFPSNGVPYPIFTYSALLPMDVLRVLASRSSSASLVSNRALVTKVYFPRVLLPLAGVTVPLVDFLLALVVLVGLMAWFDVWPSLRDRARARRSSLMAFVTALGVGALPLGGQRALPRRPVRDPVPPPDLALLSGVMYAISALPEQWQWILALNPMTAVISGFRGAFLGTPAPDLGQDAGQRRAPRSSFFVVGLWYFRRSEPRFADTI